MAKLFIIASLLFGFWYFFINGNKINEAQVAGLYKDYWSAVHAGDGEAACALLDEDYQSTVRTKTPAGTVEDDADKATACKGVDELHAMKKQMEEKTGLELFLNTEFTVEEVTVAADGKSATARVRSEIRIGTEERLLLKMQGEQTDKIVRQYAKAKFIHTDGDVRF